MDDQDFQVREIRDSQLSSLTQEISLFALNKAKALVMAYWHGKAVATTKQVASFYSTEEDSIRKILIRHREELESDGVRKLEGNEIQSARDTLSLSVKATSATIWTPRAILRTGMLLQDNQVAKQVRTVLLDQVERNPNPKQLGLDPDPWGEDDRPAEQIPSIERPTLTDKAANDVFAMLFGGETESAPVAKAPAPNQKILDGINYVLAHSNLTKVQRAILEDLLQP